MPFDVAVVGGGPAGAIAAFVLAQAGRRVVLVDAGPRLARTIGESLPGIACHLLRRLGLEHVLDGHRPAYGNVSSWGARELAATDFIADPHGLGLHLDRARFDRALREAARAAGADVRAGRVRRAERGASGWSLVVDDAELAASCVVDATGRRASIARREGATRTRDDALIAMYHWVEPETPRAPVDERTLVEAVSEGWWYTAPLPPENDAASPQARGGLAVPTATIAPHVFAFHTDVDLARALRRHGPGRVRSAMVEAFHVGRRRMPRADAEGSPPLDDVEAHRRFGRFHTTEACGARLDHFVGRGWVAAGDAALSFDPLASQGIFNALYTGMKAGEAVDLALRADPSGLAAYTRRLEEIRAVYLQRHREVYALEQRWPDEPFWRRRHGRASSMISTP